MSRQSGDEIARLSRTIAGALCLGEPQLADGGAEAVGRVVDETIRANVAEEADINREAEETLASMSRATAGMNRDALLDGIRQRIAKKRGFVL